MNDILMFTTIALFLVLSPGPNGILILKTVSGKGKVAAIQNIGGLVTATFIHGALSIMGLSALILKSAHLFMAVKFIGAAYLLYLGLKTIYNTFRKKKSNSDFVTPKNIYITHIGQNYAEGFFTQILNPKVSMFYLAAFPQFVNFQSSSYLDAFTLVSIHASIIFLWFVGVVFLISRITVISSENPISIWIQRFSGVVLVFFSGLLAVQD